MFAHRRGVSVPRSPEEGIANPQVFVIHGRDSQFVREFGSFLRAIDLHPLDWEEVVSRTGQSTPFLGDVLSTAFEDLQAAVVLLTPDDGACLHPSLRDAGDPDYEAVVTGQARPNVLFEAGMAFGLQPARTVLVEVGRLRPFSDVGGRNVIRFNGGPESRQKVASRLRTAGCDVNLSGTDWLDPRRFENLDAFTRPFP
jgi:predicted nucleotide-binding protein